MTLHHTAHAAHRETQLLWQRPGPACGRPDEQTMKEGK